MRTASEKPRALRKGPAAVKITEWTDDQKHQIAQRAYDLFLERGGQHGYHVEDWLRAEAEFSAAQAAPKRRRAAEATA